MKKRFFAVVQFPSGNLLPIECGGEGIFLASWDTEEEALAALGPLPYAGKYPVLLFDVTKGWNCP